MFLEFNVYEIKTKYPNSTFALYLNRQNEEILFGFSVIYS